MAMMAQHKDGHVGHGEIKPRDAPEGYYLDESFDAATPRVTQRMRTLSDEELQRGADRAAPAGYNDDLVV